MAYIVDRLNTNSPRSTVGLGVSLPFNSPSAFTPVYSIKDQIKYNIINYLLTDRGERIFNPKFGAGLRSYIFEQITDGSNEALESAIATTVQNQFPMVEDVTVRVLSDPDFSLVNVQFYYTLVSGEEDQILITLQNG
jgi:phage baseplate assembly protein W